MGRRRHHTPEEALALIEDYYARYGAVPSARSIAAERGWTRRTLTEDIWGLIQAGDILEPFPGKLVPRKYAPGDAK